MNEESKALYRVDLIKALEAWWDGGSDDGRDLPLLGENTIAAMADAALQVLVGVADSQEYLRGEGLLSED